MLNKLLLTHNDFSAVQNYYVTAQLCRTEAVRSSMIVFLYFQVHALLNHFHFCLMEALIITLLPFFLQVMDHIKYNVKINPPNKIKKLKSHLFQTLYALITLRFYMFFFSLSIFHQIPNGNLEPLLLVLLTCFVTKEVFNFPHL